jgi:hypothetical protein
MDGDNNMIIEIVDGITRLTADEGKEVTDGNGTTGGTLWLGEGRDANEFFEQEIVVEDLISVD